MFKNVLEGNITYFNSLRVNKNPKSYKEADKVKSKALINKLEKIGKIMLLIPAVMGITFILLLIYFELTGNNIFIHFDPPIFKFLIWGGLLILVCVSIYEFFRVYDQTTR